MAANMAQAMEKKGPVHLRFDGGKVLIFPEDHPRFEMAAKRAVDVLQQAKSIEEVLRQFNEHYLPFLNNWCQTHSDKVDRKSTRLNSSHIQKSRMPSSA